IQCELGALVGFEGPNHKSIEPIDIGNDLIQAVNGRHQLPCLHHGPATSMTTAIWSHIATTIGRSSFVSARAELGLVERHRDDPLANFIGNAVPDPIWLRWPVFEGFRPAGSEAFIPAIKCRRLDAEHLQRSSGRQMRLLDQVDDLQLFGRGEPHVWSPPSAIMLFLSSRNSSACSATTSFKSCASRLSCLTSSVVAARAESPAGLRLPASRNSFDQE